MTAKPKLYLLMRRGSGDPDAFPFFWRGEKDPVIHQIKPLLVPSRLLVSDKGDLWYIDGPYDQDTMTEFQSPG